MLCIHICYSPAGRSVLGKTVPELSSTALGLPPRAVLETEGFFRNTDQPRPVYNIFIYLFLNSKLCRIENTDALRCSLYPLRLGNKIRFHCDSFRQNPLFL